MSPRAVDAPRATDAALVRSGGERVKVERVDAEQLAQVVGQAGQQVLGLGQDQPAQTEGGERAVLLQLTEDGLDDRLAPRVPAARRRLAHLEAHRAGLPAAPSDQQAPVLV